MNYPHTLTIAALLLFTCCWAFGGWFVMDEAQDDPGTVELIGFVVIVAGPIIWALYLVHHIIMETI